MTTQPATIKQTNKQKQNLLRRSHTSTWSYGRVDVLLRLVKKMHHLVLVFFWYLVVLKESFVTPPL